MKVRVNLQPETRNGYYIDEKMKKIWNIELDLLAKLLEVCDKYNLKCYADAGTLLGAVRHKGFIPWDDDIDVTMFRSDYEKLLEVAKEEFKEPYFFQTAYSDVDYVRGHAQIRNSNTTAILNSEKDLHLKFNQGIFIDIFALDGVENSNLKYKFRKIRANFIRSILKKKYMYGNNSKTIKGKCFYYFSSIICKIFSREKIYAKFEKILKKVPLDKCENVAPLGLSFDIARMKRRKEIYKESILLDFENMKIPAPIGYDEMLKTLYGDYMTPRKEPSIHGNVIFDADVSYKKYIS